MLKRVFGSIEFQTNGPDLLFKTLFRNWNCSYRLLFRMAIGWTISHAKISRIPESGFPYMGRILLRFWETAHLPLP